MLFLWKVKIFPFILFVLWIPKCGISTIKWTSILFVCFVNVSINEQKGIQKLE
jgi:hypothetical protein